MNPVLVLKFDYNNNSVYAIEPLRISIDDSLKVEIGEAKPKLNEILKEILPVDYITYRITFWNRERTKGIIVESGCKTKLSYEYKLGDRITEDSEKEIFCEWAYIQCPANCNINITVLR